LRDRTEGSGLVVTCGSDQEMTWCERFIVVDRCGKRLELRRYNFADKSGELFKREYESQEFVVSEA